MMARIVTACPVFMQFLSSDIQPTWHVSYLDDGYRGLCVKCLNLSENAANLEIEARMAIVTHRAGD